jgi:hypothetical protein
VLASVADDVQHDEEEITDLLRGTEKEKERVGR